MGYVLYFFIGFAPAPYKDPNSMGFYTECLYAIMRYA
jgi:hypothetical protein